MRSLMQQEALQAAGAVETLLTKERATFAAIGTQLRRLAPPLVATCARGSSDHAASFFKYALEITAGLPVASIGPSVASIYGAELKLKGAALLTLSQSGKSPDIVALQAAAKASGAYTIAAVNVEGSPAAVEADAFIPLHAGVEQSVAATKSFIVSCVAGLALVAHWSENVALHAALARLPEALRLAAEQDWQAAEGAFNRAASLYIIGRGPAFPIALEAALKCKETAALHAEAFSSAEVMHGPLRLVESRFPVLAFVPQDAALEANRQSLERMAKTGAHVFVASPVSGLPGVHLPSVATGHGMTDALAAILSFYMFIERVTRMRGFNPDKPANLAKVTETV